MRKVVAYELLSLDGVAEQPDEFVTEFDDVMRENLGPGRCASRTPHVRRLGGLLANQ